MLNVYVKESERNVVCVRLYYVLFRIFLTSGDIKYVSRKKYIYFIYCIAQHER